MQYRNDRTNETIESPLSNADALAAFLEAQGGNNNHWL